MDQQPLSRFLLLDRWPPGTAQQPVLSPQIQTLAYDVVVFDTAPTGHTLRLLALPSTLDKALGKVLSLQNGIGGMIERMAGHAAPVPRTPPPAAHPTVITVSDVALPFDLTA